MSTNKDHNFYKEADKNLILDSYKSKLEYQNSKFRMQYFKYLGYLFLFILLLPWFYFVFKFIHKDELKIYFDLREILIPYFSVIVTWFLCYIANIILQLITKRTENKSALINKKIYLPFALLLISIVASILAVIAYYNVEQFTDVFKSIWPHIFFYLIMVLFWFFNVSTKSNASQHTVKFVRKMILLSTTILIFVFIFHIVKTNYSHIIYLEFFYKFVSFCIYNLLMAYGFSVFVVFFDAIITKINKNIEYKFIYWTYFIKAILLNNPQVLIGFSILILLSTLNFVIHGGGQDLIKIHLINSIAFYSFWLTAFAMSVSPVLIGFRNLSNLYNDYSKHIISNSIIPNLKNHLILIGIGNLGNLLLRNCFPNVHPEGIKRSNFYDYKNTLPSIKELSDFDILITKDLEIQLISKRIVVIEKNISIFKSIFTDIIDNMVGLYSPWKDELKNVVILGMCGEANNPFTLEATFPNSSSIIINSTPDSKLSLDLARRYIGIKQILSVNDSSSYDSLTSTTYDRSLFIIDPELIEGIAISQRIIFWINKNINHYNENVAKETRECELNRYINEKLYKYKDILSDNDLKRVAVLFKTQGKVMLIGNGKIIYYIIQSLLLALKFELKGIDVEKEILFDILKKKLALVTEDKIIRSESIEPKETLNNNLFNYSKQINYETLTQNIINENNKFIYNKSVNYSTPISGFNQGNKSEILFWKVNIIKDKFNKIDNCLQIKIYYKDSNSCSYQNYLEILKVEKPALLVLINDKRYSSIDMFVRLSNAIQTINTKFKYKPQLITFSHRDDKIYLEEQFKKYYTYNLNRHEIVGYPSQINESMITKDYITANQFSAMVKSLYNPDNVGKSNPVGEIVFSIKDRPGALAYLLSNLSGNSVVLNNNSVLVPSFLFYYSFEDRRYKNTFIFTGTAKLKKLKTDIESNYLSYCFLNCSENDRKEFIDLLIKNLKVEEIKPPISKNPNVEPEMYSNYPISTMLRHPNRHYDIMQKRTRLLELNQTDLEDDDKNDSEFFNLSHLKMWAAEDNASGTLGQVLCDIILSKCESVLQNISEQEKNKKGKDKKLTKKPLIHFSTNRPAEINEKHFIVQDSLYVELKKESYSDHLEKVVKEKSGFINAMKVKSTSEFKVFIENDETFVDKNLWIDYMLSLEMHLNALYIDKYNLYLVKKINLEGYLLGKDPKKFTRYKNKEIIEISTYSKITTDEHSKIKVETSFQIFKFWEFKNNIRSEIMYSFETDCINYSNEIVKLDEEKSNLQELIYELIIIRDKYLEESNSNQIDTKNNARNKMYFINNF
ncbi:hypothetical protein BH10BAC5_BH10BAC5_09630 [soil metagenome]